MDLQLKSAFLKKLIVHYVGSKNNLAPLHLSANEIPLSEETAQLISESFLNKFSNNFEYFSFTHTSSLQYNEVYNYAHELFLNKDRFEELSANIARHLYNASTHPKVKGGELYVVLFEGLPVEGRMHSAIGLFKTENKALFLEVAHNPNQLALQMREGVELNKFDKGCLILNTKSEGGFDVLLFDNQNRGEEAQYWKETFLGVQPQKNEYHQAAHFLTLTKQFVTEQLDAEFNLPKKDQIELLTKSIDYFKQNEAFDIDEFQQEVFGEENLINSFKDFGSRYVTHHDFDLATQFDIAPQAVKKQARIYKSVLKLDKNFHIYIHGNTDLIVKGIDTDGRKYYKIYYQEEA